MPSTLTQSLRLAAFVASFILIAPALASAQGAGDDATSPPAAHPVAVVNPHGRCLFNLPCAGGRERIRLSNAPSDSRTGGTPETAARTPGGPPDDANAGLTFELPDAHVFR